MITVAIVGRPNVGKSTLFNRIIKQRKSIVGEFSGLTRDRITEITTINRKRVLFMDTGGFTTDESEMNKHIREQAELAMEEADIMLVILDGKDGLTSVDEILINHLRRVNKPSIYCVNKSDRKETEINLNEFYALGIDNMISISAEHGKGIVDLYDRIEAEIKNFPLHDDEIPEDDEEKYKVSRDDDGKRTFFNEETGVLHKPLRIAILGRPNAGKSTLTNALTNEKRMIVSAIAGTTIDSVDSNIETEFGKVTIVDTAGIRKKSSRDNLIENIAVLKAIRALDNCDVVFLMIDAELGVAEVEKKLASEICESRACVIVCINKWDLYGKAKPEYADWFHKTLPYLSHAPIHFLSALKGHGVDDLIPMAFDIYKNSLQRIKTSQLIDCVKHAMDERPLSAMKVSFASQLKVKPQTIVIKTTNSDRMTDPYKRYLMNEIRRKFNLLGAPLRLLIGEKRSHKSPKY